MVETVDRVVTDGYRALYTSYLSFIGSERVVAPSAGAVDTRPVDRIAGAPVTTARRSHISQVLTTLAVGHSRADQSLPDFVRSRHLQSVGSASGCTNDCEQ